MKIWHQPFHLLVPLQKRESRHLLYSQVIVTIMRRFERCYAMEQLRYPHHSILGVDTLDTAYRMLEGDERLRVASVDLVPKEDEVIRSLATLILPTKLQNSRLVQSLE